MVCCPAVLVEINALARRAEAERLLKPVRAALQRSGLLRRKPPQLHSPPDDLDPISIEIWNETRLLLSRQPRRLTWEERERLLDAASKRRNDPAQARQLAIERLASQLVRELRSGLLLPPLDQEGVWLTAPRRISRAQFDDACSWAASRCLLKPVPRAADALILVY